MNFIVLLAFLSLNGVAALRERAVTRQDAAVQRQTLAQYPYLTCHDMYGHAFPDDSIRQRDLMISIGCANGRDTLKLARVTRGEVETTVVDSLVAHLAGTPRDTLSKKRP